jgi:hypothetical protein
MKKEDAPTTVELFDFIRKWNIDPTKICAPGSECYELQCLIRKSEMELFGEDAE